MKTIFCNSFYSLISYLLPHRRALLFYSLLLCVPKTLVYSYSIFSASENGIGEPVFSSNLQSVLNQNFIDSLLTFECIFRTEVVSTKYQDIKKSEESRHSDFSFPYFRFSFPIIKRTGVNISLSQLLNLNYYIEDSGQKIGEDIIKRTINSKGSANAFNLSLFNSPIHNFYIMAGTFIVFGSNMEEWGTHFSPPGINTTSSFYDTVVIKFSGNGALFSLSSKLGRVYFLTKYFSRSKLVNSHNSHLTSFETLPQRLTTFLSINYLLKTAVGYELWDWNGAGKSSAKLSFACEYRNLHAGFYMTNWYFDDIVERVGSIGYKFDFASLCLLNFSFDYGIRNSSHWELEENIYRLSFSICGKEDL